MKRAWKWLFNTLALLSLLLLVAAIVTCAWTFSGPRDRSWNYSTRSGDQISVLEMSALSYGGGFTAEVDLDKGFWAKRFATHRTVAPDIHYSAWAIHLEYGANRVTSDATLRYIRAAIPYWFAILVLTLLPALRVVLFFKFPKPEPGHCKTCGYDLRATPNQCPECGTSVPPATV